MKKLTIYLAMIIFLMIVAIAPSISQTCHLVGKECEGTCGTWYFRNGQQPVSAGQPDCITLKIEKTKKEKDKDKDPKDKDNFKYECHCVLIHSSAFCASVDGADCDGTCPSVYPSMQDAISDQNAISGVCITQRTGDAVSCGCKYTK